jgi:hypothetical protein
MTDFVFYFLVSLVSSTLTAILLWRNRSWTDDDHYTLVERYAESTSALTAMKAELDKLQEQLEFSEDVRYTLGMNNAKMAQRIEDLEANKEASADLRLKMIEMLDKVINMRLALGKRLTEVQRSLRIARHKEFKRWKKLVSKRHRQKEVWSQPLPTHADWFNRCCYFRCYCTAENYKQYVIVHIQFSRNLDPYPLP